MLVVGLTDGERDTLANADAEAPFRVGENGAPFLMKHSSIGKRAVGCALFVYQRKRVPPTTTHHFIMEHSVGRRRCYLRGNPRCSCR
jgi:hypothetical protein